MTWCAPRERPGQTHVLSPPKASKAAPVRAVTQTAQARAPQLSNELQSRVEIWAPNWYVRPKKLETFLPKQLKPEGALSNTLQPQRSELFHSPRLQLKNKKHSLRIRENKTLIALWPHDLWCAKQLQTTRQL